MKSNMKSSRPGGFRFQNQPDFAIALLSRLSERLQEIPGRLEFDVKNCYGSLAYPLVPGRTSANVVRSFCCTAEFA